jgi:hypothetical protein
MKKILFTFIPAFIFIGSFHVALAFGIELNPESPIQGEPVLITLVDVSATSSIKSATIGKEKLNFFIYDGKTSALYGVDLSAKVGTTTVSVLLKNGESAKKELIISPRPKVEAPLDIPQKLGGNTPQAAKKLVKNLINEQEIVGKIMSVVKPKAFWKDNFVFPVKNPIITDNYGYSRDTVGYSIAHKGTDFKASVGTEVMAINRGVVRDVRVYPTFGRTIIVDHGFGLYSMYLHLSKAKVSVGQLVQPNQLIALSGDSGYANGAHLHLTIRLNGKSIDPMKFYELFGVKI